MQRLFLPGQQLPSQIQTNAGSSFRRAVAYWMQPEQELRQLASNSVSKEQFGGNLGGRVIPPVCQPREA
jgi:hypothetical protein